MDNKDLIIIALVIALIYLAYQKQKSLPNLDTKNSPEYLELHNQLTEVLEVNKIFAKFCQEEIGGKDIQEIRTKLNCKKLTQILTENEDYELEVDSLTRTKNELEADLLAQSNSFKSSLKEKDGTIKKLENEKKQLGKDLSNLHSLSKIQSQKVSDLEQEVKKLAQDK